jgi:amicyanin
MKVKKTLAGILSGTMIALSLPVAVGAVMLEPSPTMSTDVQVFSDVSMSHPNRTAILYLKDHGVISGYPDGTFKPDQVVNRAETLKIILLGSGVTVPETIDLEPFRDISRTEWYAPYVAKAKELEIVEGYPDGTFRADQTVNLVENLKILLLTQNVDLSAVVVNENPYADAFADQWYAPYVMYAKMKNLIDADADNKVYPAQGMTRAKLAEAMYRLMYMKEMGWDSYQLNGQTQQTMEPVTVNVDIIDFAYSQPNLTVTVGSKVTWTNKDNVVHTVTGDTDVNLNSGNLGLNQSYSMTFNTPGTYAYHCTPHPFMTGKVTVTE